MPSKDEALKPEDLLVLNVPQPVPYDEQRKEAHAAQQGRSRAEIAQELIETSESTFDPETAHQTHNWVDRGLKLSCEGAGHPNHHITKRLRVKEQRHVSRWLK